MNDRKTVIDSGFEIIAAINATELTPLELRDILYKTVTKDYEIISRILEAAREEGLVERGENIYRITPGSCGLDFESPKIVSMEENTKCELCRKSLKTGYYLVFRTRTLGPYGPACIRKIRLGSID